MSNVSSVISKDGRKRMIIGSANKRIGEIETKKYLKMFFRSEGVSPAHAK